MASRARLPKAVTSRRVLFANRFDDVILSDDRIVVLPAVIMTLSSKRFCDHLLAQIPQSSWITFRFGRATLVGPEETAFMDAMMEFWREDDRIDPDLRAIGNELLHEFIKMLKAKAPGAINAAFGGLFTP